MTESEWLSATAPEELRAIQAEEAKVTGVR
jgi:hypothetical protein